MTTVLDVVNFNADASCLRASDWLDALAGGDESLLCRWLSGFVEFERKVVLGIVGGTVADMATHNPEAIARINEHPDVFEIVVRPFSHDVALLRTVDGFWKNFELGRRTIEREFARVSPYYLPPEFMLTNEQVATIADAGIRGVFINASRFNDEARKRIPESAYELEGLFDSRIAAIPLDGALTRAYLESLHSWENSTWYGALRRCGADAIGCWRDGESWLFVPDGVDRERAWLANESPSIRRGFVEEVFPPAEVTPLPDAPGDVARCYPVHSFSDWVKEFRMLGYLRRVRDRERHLAEFNLPETAAWLQAINSDVLSAVEKASPVIRIRTRPPADNEGEARPWTIPRSARGFEGEEYLALLERLATSDRAQQHLATSQRPHIVKLRGRLDYLRTLGDTQ